MANLNTATADELQAVKGIGEKKASAIVAYPSEHGTFASMGDFLSVKRNW